MRGRKGWGIRWDDDDRKKEGRNGERKARKRNSV